MISTIVFLGGLTALLGAAESAGGQAAQFALLALYGSACVGIGAWIRGM
jgi:hypothetical protein